MHNSPATAALRHLQNHWQLIALIVLIFLLWPTQIIQPLRILIVFLHEMSHAVVTLLTGGSVLEFSVSANESGHVTSLGGNRFLTLSAGYLGSLLIGAMMFALALRSTWDQWILGALGIGIAAITVLYIRSPFALLFGLGTAAILIAIAYTLRPAASDFCLRIIGATSMIYVPYDIFSDTIRGAAQRSDARMLAEEFGGATLLWGALWLLISIAFIAATVRTALKHPSNIRWNSPKT